MSDPLTRSALRELDRPLETPEAAAYIHMSVSFLRQSRTRKGHCDGPPYHKGGTRVRYLIEDLDKWMEEHKVDPSACGEDEEARHV